VVVADDLPLIDLGRGAGRAVRREAVGAAVDDACRTHGFFRVVGHGVDLGLRDRLDRAARQFFALADVEKQRIAMERGGAAWRGWFPLGGELTSGRPDRKEGLYFGEELATDHPAVREGRPLHGPNLFPRSPADLRPVVLAWLDAMAALGADLLRCMAAGLGLDAHWFERTVTRQPTVLFRIFRYPPVDDRAWGVAEHTDYGLVTILAQDGHDGLEVHGPDGWIAVPGDPDVLVINLGDMLERMTRGRYRSTPHRVRNTGPADRLSFPCFVDPSWEAVCPTMPLPEPAATASDRPRWDGADPRAWQGTYGDYLTAKVARVFPALDRDVRPRQAP
jgi:isopenicillin N synthase-like dioxygenase